MKSVSLVIYIVLFTLLQSCSSVDSNVTVQEELDNWLVSEEEVINGGPGKDGIPSIDNPQFTSMDQVNFVDDQRLVIGIKVGDQVKAYPHQILDWHEIVNDQIGDLKYALTYCPLTGTGISWGRTFADKENEFGVSGLLYRNNLIAYDRRTDTNWSQMQMRAVNGELAGTTLETLSIVETTWETWKNMYPNSMILNTNTGYTRNYGGFAYGSSYLTDNSDLLFPVKNIDRRLPTKTRVHAVILSEVTGEEVPVRVYNIEDMSDSVRVINESYEDTLLVAAGSARHNFTVSFHRELEDGTILEFEPVLGALPIIMKDQEGNNWDLFGEAVSGPRTGLKLKSPQSYTGYWFSIADFFPLSCIYPDSDCKRIIDK